MKIENLTCKTLTAFGRNYIDKKQQQKVYEKNLLKQKQTKKYSR